MSTFLCLGCSFSGGCRAGGPQQAVPDQRLLLLNHLDEKLGVVSLQQVRLPGFEIIANPLGSTRSLAQKGIVSIAVPVPPETQLIKGGIERISLHFPAAGLEWQIVHHDLLLEFLRPLRTRRAVRFRM
jgi:hypothetical protein